MRSILEFALFAWVGISVIAVLVQLVRIARYKRATASSQPDALKAEREAPTINLSQRLGSTDVPNTTVTDSTPTSVMASATTVERATEAAAKPAAPSVSFAAPSSAPAPTAPPSATQPAAAASPVAPAPSAAPTATPEPMSVPKLSIPKPVASESEAVAPSAISQAAPTLADLLAGVRLPWNLLPTVDQSREPSNERVVLITSEGEPADIGIDVADELERLGFTIAPRGDDTAVATRGEHSLGLQIIEEPMAAEIDGTRRFPTATESSVALDIWIE